MSKNNYYESPGRHPTPRPIPRNTEHPPFREVMTARNEQLDRMIGSGALKNASDTVESHMDDDNDLGDHLTKLVDELRSFDNSSFILDRLRSRYPNPSQMSDGERTQYEHHKAVVRQFNQTLREVIDNGASKFNFEQLLGFMVSQYSATNGREDIHRFNERAYSTIVGARDEIGFEQLLIVAGYNYRRGSLEQDGKGIDYIVEDMPLDCKSNETTVWHARQRARNAGHDTAIIWSHITSEDYRGELSLPYATAVKRAKGLQPELDVMIDRYSIRSAA